MSRATTYMLLATLSVACATTAPPRAATDTPRRASPSANHADPPLALRMPSPGEQQHVIIVHDVEREALWTEGRRTANRLKYVFEVERRIDPDAMDSARYEIARLDGGVGVRPLQGTEVSVRSAPERADVTVNGAPATKEQRAVLAALVAYEAAIRNAASLLPPPRRASPSAASSGAAQFNAAWQPSQRGLAEFLRGTGAKVEPSSIQATGYVKERFACGPDTCAQLEIQLHASVSDRIRVRGALHLWLTANRAEPPRKLLWELSMSEPGSGGRAPTEQRVVQRLEAIVLPIAK